MGTGDSDSIGIADIQSKNAQTLTDIQGLQIVENELLQTLETGTANNSLTYAQKTDILSQIDKISKMRTTLYANISGLQTFFQKNINFASTTLNEQVGAIQIVEDELNEAKKRYKIVQEDKDNKLRLVEINTYYGDKYSNHSNIMKTIVVVCLHIIILSFLANRGIIPQTIYIILLIIGILVGVIYIWYQVADSLYRDNMNYQEYQWDNGKPPTLPEKDNSIINAKDPWAGIGLTCMGQACCDTGFTYVPSPANKCVANTGLPDGVTAYVPPVDPASNAATAD